MSNPYETLVKELRGISTLGTVGSLLGWDEQVMLKPGGTEFRSDQSSLLARLTHERFTSKQIGDLIAANESAKPDGDAAVVVREIRREYERATKLPTSLVEA